MKQARKRLVSLILALAMSMSLFGTNAWAAEADETDGNAPAVETVEKDGARLASVVTGKCGPNATFSYDTATKTMTVTGKGSVGGYDLESEYFSYHAVKTLKILGSIASIDDWAFWGFNIMDGEPVPMDLTIGDTVTSIGEGAFWLTELKTVKLGKNIIQIGALAFGEQSYLSSVSLPSKLKTIGDYAFLGCNSMKQITIPESVTKIGKQAVGYGDEGIDGDEDEVYKISGFKIMGAKGSAAETYAKENDFSFKYSGGVYSPSFKLSNASKGVTIKWGSVSGAAKYRVFRKEVNGTYKKVADTASTSYTDTTAKEGTAYIYTVRCLNSKGGYNSIQPYGKRTVRLTTPSISGLKNSSGKKMKVTWKKKSKATGYQIQYSTSSQFSGAKTVTVSKNSTTSKTISGLKKGKNYYVRIRTYKSSAGKKFYSGWSSTKKVKISK